jgi:hydroxymethylpyrimidine pyrophosphatase-like HAD family hydrolase
MKTILFADIDDSLVYSVRTLTDHALRAKVGAYKNDGSINSYFTPKSLQLLAQFKDMLIIPVTGRTYQSLLNVTLPFEGHKVIAHGNIILDENNRFVDDYNPSNNNPFAAQNTALFEQYKTLLRQRLGAQADELRMNVVSELGINCYLSIKGDSSLIDEVYAIVKDFMPGPVVHMNNRNIAILPEQKSKMTAVTYLIDRLKKQYGELFTIGLGDSHSDLPFMQLCDYLIYPQQSQIAERYYA